MAKEMSRLYNRRLKGDFSVKAIVDRQSVAFAPGSVCVEVASTSLERVCSVTPSLLCIFVEVVVFDSKYDKDRYAAVIHRNFGG